MNTEQIPLQFVKICFGIDRVTESMPTTTIKVGQNPLSLLHKKSRDQEKIRK